MNPSIKAVPSATPVKFTGPRFTPARKSQEFSLDPKFTILVKATKSRVDGLSIEGVIEPQDGPASIVFITKAGKKWKMGLNELSFVFPAKVAA